MLELRTGQSLLEVKPELGGALGRWTRDGLEIFHPVSDPNLIAQHLETAGAYPLIPFSNRVGYGKFAFGGESFQLLPNFKRRATHHPRQRMGARLVGHRAGRGARDADARP